MELAEGMCGLLCMVCDCTHRLVHSLIHTDIFACTGAVDVKPDLLTGIQALLSFLASTVGKRPSRVELSIGGACNMYVGAHSYMVSSLSVPVMSWAVEVSTASASRFVSSDSLVIVQPLTLIMSPLFAF